MGHKKNRPGMGGKKKPQPVKTGPVEIHPPDPDHPEGMAFVFAAGFVDPRPGGYPGKTYPNQQLVLKQSWNPTSAMWWELGIRWHPELAKKWVKGGGQWFSGEVVDTRPDPRERLDNPDYLREKAQEMVEDQFESMEKHIQNIRDNGTDEQKEALQEQFRQGMRQMQHFMNMIETEIDSGDE